MQIERVGLSPVKGARHKSRRHVDLAADGPVGDRVFGLVDRARARVVRTVENPTLLAASTSWADDVLSVELAGETWTGVPEPTGEHLLAEYWGRQARVEVVSGPWSAAYSAHLGYDVELVRSTHAGEVVYADPVTLVTRSSLTRLSELVGEPVDAARFRATFVVDDEDLESPGGPGGPGGSEGTAGLEPQVEDAWAGQELRLGAATIRVGTGIPRCAVVDLDPSTGHKDLPVLKTLAGYRLDGDGIFFGVYAGVVAPGTVRVGDVAELVRG